MNDERLHERINLHAFDYSYIFLRNMIGLFLIHVLLLVNFTGFYPIIGESPEFIFRTVPAMYNGVSFNDYYFICRINYTQLYAGDGSKFKVFLLVDWWETVYPYKITDGNNLDVIFTSSEVSGLFGRTVSH
jgi:hypothetical protein